MVRAQGGYITGWGGQQVPLMNSFFGGPTWCVDLRPTVLARAISVFGYGGPTSFGSSSLQVANKNVVRSSVGVGLTWASPFGALTVDYAVPITKAAYDVVQPFRFSAGGF